MRHTFAALLAAIALTACAGTAFNWNQARAIKEGMTAEELQKIMGEPYMVTTRGDETIWVYSQANGFTGSHKSVTFVLKDQKVVGLPTIPSSF